MFLKHRFIVVVARADLEPIDRAETPKQLRQESENYTGTRDASTVCARMTERLSSHHGCPLFEAPGQVWDSMHRILQVAVAV